MAGLTVTRARGSSLGTSLMKYTNFSGCVFCTLLITTLLVVLCLVTPCFCRIQGSVTHCEIGIQILQQLVCEMNQVESMRSLTKHRKMASSFREESLYDIFTLSCTLLQQISVHDETQVCCTSSMCCSSMQCYMFLSNSSTHSFTGY